MRRLIAAALLAALPSMAQAQSTLRIVLVNDLASLDPVISTAAFVRNHGFMNYDQLFALDSKGEAQPQMVGAWSKSPDGMAYSFTLRDGLAYHDGTPVRAADAVASIKRWAQRDVVGRALAAATASMDATDDKTFTLKLSRPFALVTEALARPTASALFVMPERIANTPPTTAFTDPLGSGPFIFQKDLWRAGDRARAIEHFNECHRLQPDNWTYKRQAWSVVSNERVGGDFGRFVQGPLEGEEDAWPFASDFRSDVAVLGEGEYYPSTM